jgi:hypothetical protein
MPMHHAYAMQIYARLAVVSCRRGQKAAGNRFLVLTGTSAARAGYPQVADRCRELVLAGAPLHLLRRYPTFAEALRDPLFEPFERQLTRHCGLERAEFLLASIGEPLPGPASERDAAEEVLAQLERLS